MYIVESPTDADRPWEPRRTASPSTVDETRAVETGQKRSVTSRRAYLLFFTLLVTCHEGDSVPTDFGHQMGVSNLEKSRTSSFF